MKKIKQLFSKGKARVLAMTGVLATLAFSTTGFCTEETGLTFNFNATEMFTWTNTMLDVMMPILYITLGISLAFVIMRALRSAFS